MANESQKTKLQLVKVVDENLVKTLSYLLTMAMDGKIQGFAGIAYSNMLRHKVLASGKYLIEPHAAIRPLKELELVIDSQCKKLEDLQVVKIK